MQSGSEGFYVGLGGGMRSTACNNWHTKRVESTPGVDDAIGENPDGCFSTAGRVSVYVGTRNTLGITSDINLRTHTALVGITMKLGR